METVAGVIGKMGSFPCSEALKREGVIMENVRNWIIAIAAGIIAFYIVYGSIFQGFLTLGSDISTIKTNSAKGLEKLSDIKTTLTYSTSRTAALISPEEYKGVKYY